MNLFTRRVLFFLFFLSGFSSLVYQVIWTRMAFASFGITNILSQKPDVRVTDDLQPFDAKQFAQALFEE
jgi:hypothetical protein